MSKFEKVSRFAAVDLEMPQRATAGAAGYDFIVAEDIVVPPYEFLHDKIRASVGDDRLKENDYYALARPLSLDEVAAITKEKRAKVTLVSTGMKCKLDPGYYLELSVRSSTPLKHWLVMANGVGIVDTDYYNSSESEGEIMFPLINLGPYAIALKRGDRIGQGIIKPYAVTEDDVSGGVREGGFGSTS